MVSRKVKEETWKYTFVSGITNIIICRSIMCDIILLYRSPPTLHVHYNTTGDGKKCAHIVSDEDGTLTLAVLTIL